MNKRERDVYDRICLKVKNQARNISEISESLRIKGLALWRTQEEKEFLKSRIIEVYGKQAYVDLLNHISYPNIDTLEGLMDKNDEKIEELYSKREEYKTR